MTDEDYSKNKEENDNIIPSNYDPNLYETSLIYNRKIEIVKKLKNVFFTKNIFNSEKTFIILDYDSLNNFNFFNLLSSFEKQKNLFFLLKTNQNFISKENFLNFKLFFEWEDIFDYLSLFESKSIFYLENNIDRSIFYKYNLKQADFCEIKDNNNFKNISGILF